MKKRTKFFIIQVILIVFQFLMVEFSNRNSFITDVKWYMFLFNFMTYLLLIAVIQVVVQKWWISNIIFSVVLFIFSIVNYFVITYHGMPLSYQEFANAKTAMNVAGNYSFSFTKRIAAIIICFLLSIVFSLLLKKYENNLKVSKKCQWLTNCGIIVSFLIFFSWGYISDVGLKEKMTINWSWTDQYRYCRVLPCFIESFVKGLSKVKPPEGYSEARVEEIYKNTTKVSATTDCYPDIILILNETFYDLNMVTTMDTEPEYVTMLKGLDNKITGYAVSPSIGGGTNCAEYELLTSNSLQLLGNITPFTSLDLTGSRSVASLLKEYNYVTLAAHPAPGSNYSRTYGYTALGFDEIKFFDDFDKIDYYYDRWYATDECVYRNLKSWYESMPDKPRFLYTLTFQNHGDWNQNDDEYDTIHTKRDFGKEMNSTINEYLTGISMSDQALYDLICYYQTSDRPVIICMVGDHAPSFVDEVADSGLSMEERELRERSTPFIIWSNTFKQSEDMGTISMIYLVPMLLREAGLPLSDYYSYLMNMEEKLPIVSSYGVYYDVDNNMYSYEENTKYEQMVRDYFTLEYYNVYVDKIEN